MALYSVRYASIDTSGSAWTDFYLVPASGGPAIVKGISYAVPAGADCLMGVLIDGFVYAFWERNNTAGSETIHGLDQLWQVLNPADQVQVISTTGAACQVTASGYQFRTP